MKTDAEAKPTPADYKRERTLRGTQAAVAGLLEVDHMTISRRERGEREISREAWLALLSLPMVFDLDASPPKKRHGTK